MIPDKIAQFKSSCCAANDACWRESGMCWRNIHIDRNLSPVILFRVPALETLLGVEWKTKLQTFVRVLIRI